MIALTNNNLVDISKTEAINKQLLSIIKLEWISNNTYWIRPWDFSMCMELVPPKQTDVVLDIGCGISPFIFFIADYVSKVYGIDNGVFSNYKQWHDTLTEFDDYNNGKVEVITQNAAQLPYPNETFDIVYTFSALEHFNDDDESACMKEVYRVLKSNGVFCGTVDFNPITEFPRKGMKKAFTRTYTYEAFISRIIEPSGLSLLGEFHKLNPMPESVAYVAKEMFFALVKDKS